MKLGFITALHGRHKLTELFAEHTSQFGLPVFASITEGDTANVLTAERFGVTYREMPNEPVGDKFQIALDMAMEAGCDAVMVLPSDDFISQEYVEAIFKMLDNGIPYMLPQKIAIHHPVEGTYELRSDGKSCGRYGAGRVVIRNVIEACGGTIWADKRNRSLDSESHGRILAAGFKCVPVRTKDIPLVDIKTGDNIWPWRTWRGGGHRCSADQALHMLSPSMREQLRSTPSAHPQPA